MSRKSQFILAFVMGSLCLAGTWWLTNRLSTGVAGQLPSTREVTDMTGRTVRLPDRPARILSLCTSASDTIAAMREEGRLVAIDQYSRVVPGIAHAAVIGKGSAVSKEHVLALKIDLAFLWWYQDDAAAMLEDLSIPTVRIRSGRAAELPAVIRLVGDCVDRRVEAERLASWVETFLAHSSAQPPQNGPRVFLELYGPLKTMGRDTYTNDLLELAGACNVATDAAGSVLFSAERLVQADPDAILLVGDASDKAALIARPGMAQLKAVRQGRVFALDRYWLVAGPNMPSSVEKIRAVFHGSFKP